MTQIFEHRRTTPEPLVRDLTEEEVAAYDRDGAILLRGFFSDHWVETVGAAIDRLAENPTPFGKLLSGKGLHSDLYMWKYDQGFHDFIFSSPAAHIAQQIMRSSRVNFVVDHMFKKDPGCAIPTLWHRDESAWPVQGRQRMNIWLACDNVSTENSALQFVAGSHLWARSPLVDDYKGAPDERVERMLGQLGWKPTKQPALPSEEDEVTSWDVIRYGFQGGVHRQYEQDMATTPIEPDLEGLVSVEPNRDRLPIVSWDVQPGDALVFHFRTLHYSTGNQHDTIPRRALGTRWSGDDAVYTPRVGNVPVLWEHDLRPGDPMGGPLYPQILPETRPEEEGAHRMGAEAENPGFGYRDLLRRLRAAGLAD
ncbi:phytanoyl-CoA dioxygenase family protein [Nonomuraea sp. NPDC049141]|uniref:phytanoyl-CoA dioxygenase family protein n=1 Tax=Nonomuraea sp. NPDC049141 TaxID=3155500 RepID=UPI0033F19612